jgi:septation ring formation regulator EzrA
MDVDERLTVLEHKMDMMLEKLDKLLDGQEKLDNHISFIENVYNTIRKPLFCIMDYANYYLHGEEPKLVSN